MKTVKPKPSSFYWNIITSMGWAKAVVISGSRPDCEAIKRDFMETYSEKVAENFNAWYCVKYRELVTAYDAAEKESGNRYGNFGTADSFGDMMDHVMGLGQEYYNAIMADFKLLNNLETVESFAYCIPHVHENINDYGELKPKTHQKQARKALKAIAANIADFDLPTESLVVMGETMNRLVLIIAGKFEEAVGDLDFKKDYNTYYDYDGCGNGAQYANTLFDCKKYMT